MMIIIITTYNKVRIFVRAGVIECTTDVRIPENVEYIQGECGTRARPFKIAWNPTACW